MVKNILPPGFRFHPTDVELVQYYLRRKVMEKSLLVDAIAVVDLYKLPPWDLPAKSSLKSRDLEWYFFCPRDRKYANGPRTNRATETGYWKTTGKDRSIYYKFRIVGMKKTLVFHVGRAPKGTRTDWVMHEYRLEDKEVANAGYLLDAYVLCRIFEKSGPGPKNGEQYGAPFNEEEWEEDDVENVNDGQLTLFGVADDLCTPLVPKHTEIGSSSQAPPINDGNNQMYGNQSALHADGQETSFSESRELEGLLMELHNIDDVPLPDTNVAVAETSSGGQGNMISEKSNTFQDGSEIYNELGDITTHEQVGRLYSSNQSLDKNAHSYGYVEVSDFVSSGQTDQTGFGTSSVFHPFEGMDAALLSDFEATGCEGYTAHAVVDQNVVLSISPLEVAFYENELQGLFYFPEMTSDDKSLSQKEFHS